MTSRAAATAIAAPHASSHVQRTARTLSAMTRLRDDDVSPITPARWRPSTGQLRRLQVDGANDGRGSPAFKWITVPGRVSITRILSHADSHSPHDLTEVRMYLGAGSRASRQPRDSFVSMPALKNFQPKKYVRACPFCTDTL